MVSPKDAVESVKTAILNDSTHLTEVDDVVTHELDLDKEDVGLTQPFVAIYPIDVIRSNPHDTDRVGYVTDNNGDKIGERFRATFDIPLQIDIHAARGNSDLDMDELGWELTKLLRPYDRHNENQDLPNSQGEIPEFLMGDGERNDNLSMSPGLARWSHESMLTFFDEVEATDHVDTIKVVHTPHDGDFASGTTGNVAIEYAYA